MRRSVCGRIAGRDSCRKYGEHPVVCECPKPALRDLVEAARLIVENLDHLPERPKHLINSGRGWTGLAVLAQIDPDDPEDPGLV